MSKKIILFLSILTGMLGANGQTLSPAVIASGGSFSTAGGNSLSWTMGEPVITTIQAGGYMLTQGFQQSEPGQALPVSLIDFNAVRENKSMVRLIWNTAGEHNNKGFDVERRLESEIAFSPKGFASSLALNGNSDLKLHYTYDDQNSFEGVSYYRLKQIDKDNNSAYTIIKAVNGAGNATVSLVIFPNPNNGQFKIIVEGNVLPVTAIISNLNGSVIRKLEITGSSPVMISNMASGTYMVSIPGMFGAGKAFTEKVIINK